MKQRSLFRRTWHTLWVAVTGFGLGVLAFILLGLALMSPQAHADTTDDVYLIVIHQHGVDLGSTDMEIKLGHAVCQDLHQGAGMIPEAAHLAAIWTDPTLTVKQATAIVGAAGASYCPDEDPFVSTAA